MPVKKHNVETVSYMFSDRDNIKILPVVNDDEADMYLAQYRRLGYNIVSLGFYGQDFMKGAKTFDESFYNQAGVEYSERWDSFFFPKKGLKKIEASDFLNKKGGEYIFVHDDKERGLNINTNTLPDLPIIRPKHLFGKSCSVGFFDYLELIKNANEIHCMDSSFAMLIDHISDLRDKPKSIHRYLREDNLNPYYKKNWKIIE